MWQEHIQDSLLIILNLTYKVVVHDIGYAGYIFNMLWEWTIYSYFLYHFFFLSLFFLHVINYIYTILIYTCYYTVISSYHHLWISTVACQFIL